MKLPRILLTLAAVAALALKLFTVEFHLPDDPTAGIAWRSSPGWSNREVMADHGSQRHRILAQSENGSIFETPYRAIVQWGWLTLLVAAALSFAIRPKAASGGGAA